MLDIWDDKLHAQYESGLQVRINGLDEESAESLYSRTLRFVVHFSKSGTLLDVGCGAGWLAYLFSKRGFNVTGVDLNPAGFEAPMVENLKLLQGSATALPLSTGQFDVVLANTMLEHTARPQEVLREMIRVLKPGGLLFVTGPNLIALGPSLKALLQVWRTRPVRDIFLRNPAMQKFPFGVTLPEIVASLCRNLCRVSLRLVIRGPKFEFREPETRPPFHADNDAIFLCNPVDLSRFLAAEGLSILRDVDLGRSRVTRFIAGGTWIAALKPIEVAGR